MLYCNHCKEGSQNPQFETTDLQCKHFASTMAVNPPLHIMDKIATRRGICSTSFGNVYNNAVDEYSQVY